jgi:hypothetical protein
MMIIVRIFPKGELKESWHRLLSNLERISNEHCTPLYLSHQEDKNFMSLIYDVKDMDHFDDIIVKKIPSTMPTEKTRTLTLLKPVFFPVRKDTPANLERYVVAVQVTSGELENIFNHILNLDYPNDVFPTYVAYSFGEDDILTSMLSTSRDKIKKFIEEKLARQRGVLNVEITRIGMSKRIAPPEMWKKYRESKYAFKPRAEHEEYDFLERAAMTEAFVRELRGNF